MTDIKTLNDLLSTLDDYIEDTGKIADVFDDVPSISMTVDQYVNYLQSERVNGLNCIDRYVKHTGTLVNAELIDDFKGDLNKVYDNDINLINELSQKYDWDKNLVIEDLLLNRAFDYDLKEKLDEIYGLCKDLFSKSSKDFNYLHNSKTTMNYNLETDGTDQIKESESQTLSESLDEKFEKEFAIDPNDSLEGKIKSSKKRRTPIRRQEVADKYDFTDKERDKYYQTVSKGILTPRLTSTLLGKGYTMDEIYHMEDISSQYSKNHFGQVVSTYEKLKDLNEVRKVFDFQTIGNTSLKAKKNSKSYIKIDRVLEMRDYMGKNFTPIYEYVKALPGNKKKQFFDQVKQLRGTSAYQTFFQTYAKSKFGLNAKKKKI